MKRERLFFVFAAAAAWVLIFTGCFAEDQFVPGVRTEKDYVNESLGIRIDLGENYVMATDEEIKQMMQIGMDKLLEEDNAKNLMDISDITLYYDMMAVNPLDGSSINIIAEKPILSGITMKQYLDANLISIQNYLGVDTVQQGQMDICGISYETMSYPISAAGIYVVSVANIAKVGDRFVTISVSGTSEEGINNTFGLLSCIDR